MSHVDKPFNSGGDLPAADVPFSVNRPSEGNAPLKPHPPITVTESLKDVLTIAGGAGIVCYALGFIIVSLFLQTWQIYDVSLLSGRYISVGICLLLFLAITVLPSFYLFKSLFEKGLTGKTNTPAKFAIAAVLCLLLPAAASVLIAVVLSTQLLPDQRPETSFWFWYDMYRNFSFLQHQWPSLLEWHLPLYGLGVLMALGASFGWRDKLLQGVPNGFWLSILVALCLIIATKSYVAGYFTAISQVYGGGQYSDIEIVIDEDAIDAVTKLGMDDDAEIVLTPKSHDIVSILWTALECRTATPKKSSDKSVKLRKMGLLDQNDKTYFLLIYNKDETPKHSAQLDKSFVKGATLIQKVTPEVPKN